MAKHNKNSSTHNENPYALPQIEEVNSENSQASPYYSNPKPGYAREDSVKRKLDFSTLTPLKESTNIVTNNDV